MVLLVEPFDATLVEVWSARVQRGAAVRWAGFVRRWAARPHLPASADYPALARQWADRVGVDRVHLVVAAGADATGLAARALGLDLQRSASGSAAVEPRWRPLGPAAVDVLRRVNAVLTVRVEAPRGERLVRELAVLLDAQPDRGGGLTVPAAFAGWAAERARGLADELRSGGYPVHGDPDRVVPRSAGLPTRPSRADVLRTVVDACLGQAGASTGPRKAEQR